MVDLRGKPPYLPKDMSYTDVLKMAIDRGLRYFGYDAETWIDETTFNRWEARHINFISNSWTVFKKKLFSELTSFSFILSYRIYVSKGAERVFIVKT